MDSTYQAEHSQLMTLQNRLNGIQREHDIYEYVLTSVGQKVTKAALMRRFNYYINNTGNTDNFNRTRLQKYIEEVRNQVPTRRGRWITKIERTIRDVVWLPAEVADSHRIMTIASMNQRWGYKLCFKETVPFWLLKEYGGPHSPTDFIYDMRRLIFDTKQDIKELIQTIKGKMIAECPCEDCICIPTCRLKLYITLTVDCALVDDYLFNPQIIASDPKKELFFGRLQSVVDNIKPTKWDLNTITEKAKKGGAYAAPT